MTKKLKTTNEFTNVYSISKTLKFALNPIGKTQKTIKKLIEQDKQRAEDYKRTKELIDDFLRDHIAQKLSNFVFKESDLSDLSDHLSSNETNPKIIEKKQSRLRKQISKQIDIKFDKNFLKEKVLSFLSANAYSNHDKSIVESFLKWNTYFTNFYDTRKNIITSDDIPTSVAYRTIHVNFPKYINNIKRLQKARELGVDFSELDKTISQKIKNIESIANYNNYLTQEGIEEYNYLVGGKSTERIKIQGLNEIINLYAQKNPESAKLLRYCKLEELYKQILSDKHTKSFVLDEIHDDKAIFELIDNYIDLEENQLVFFSYDEDPETGKLKKNTTKLSTICNQLQSLVDADLDKIYVKSQSIASISNLAFGHWLIISEALGVSKTDISDKSYLSLYNIISKLDNFYSKKENNEQKLKILGEHENFETLLLEKLMNLGEFNSSLKQAYDSYRELKEKYSKENNSSLKTKDNDVKKLKSFLDDLIEFRRQVLRFEISDPKFKLEKDSMFYVDYEKNIELLFPIISIYNKVRNYITKKAFSENKFKLNFQNQNLASGWAKNKEKDNTSIILKKECQDEKGNSMTKYFLAIMNKNHNKLFDSKEALGNGYQKMNYHQLSKIKANLPRILFSSERIKHFDPSDEVISIRNHNTHTKGGKPQDGYEKKEFSINDCHKWINFCKKSIAIHPEWGKLYNFKFTDTEKYKDVTEFYAEVDAQAYNLDFTNVSEQYENQMVEEEKLYLFEIYSKDFSPKSKGTKNLHTLYWEALFSEENLKDVVYKLNGEAELFFRPASIQYNSEIWQKGHHASDPKKKQNYPIVKDRRYAKDRFLFHVPITLNFKANGEKRFETKVNKFLQNNPDINIIGIDRGERNLAYLTVIDQNGDLLYQESLNKINGTDYHQKLDEKEKERLEARQEWKSIQKIKDLKQGYLSQVVNKIVKLMIEYNAIVALEDLNFGFKRGRFKIEKQIYQKMEKMLIDKLSYLVDKSQTNNNQNLGLYKALQLSSEFTTFEKIGKQMGFLFYVPAYHTSKICPVTGFVNLLNPKYKSKLDSLDFFSRFDKISYNGDYFEFEFDYKKFKNIKSIPSKSKWTVCSYGKRLSGKRVDGYWTTEWVELTTRLKELFQKYAIDYSYKQSIVKQIVNEKQDVSFFKELTWLFKLCLQMRNSGKDENTNKELDFICSPIKSKEGNFFNSNEVHEGLPQDADANGAYHIALKASMLLDRINNTDLDNKKVDFSIKNEQWYNFVHSRNN